MPDGIGWTLIIAGILIGSLIGYIMAVKVEMTECTEMVALFNGFGGLHLLWLLFLRLGNGLKRHPRIRAYNDSSCWCGRIECTSWVDDTYRFTTLNVQIEGGVEIFGKWIRTPTWGPWQHPVKALLFISVLVLIYLSN